MGMRAVIADDEVLIRMYIREILENNGYEVAGEAEDGMDAVTVCREQRPDFVIMDINMPVMDGYEATREIRKFSLQVPIIAVTAFAYASDEQKAMENGFNAYMSKPINAGQLRTKITSILQRHVVFM